MKFQFKIKDNLIEKLLLIKEYNWLITIFVFGSIFMMAVFIWQDCILNPQPSELIVNKILNTGKEYESKMQNIKKNYQFLKDRDSEFNQPKRNLKEKDYFQVFGSEQSINLNYKASEGGYNPELVL